MSVRLVKLVVIIAMQPAVATYAFADQERAAEQCKPVLSSVTVHFKSMSKQAQIAWLNSFDQHSFEQNRSGINASVPGYGELTWD